MCIVFGVLGAQQCCNCRRVLIEGTFDGCDHGKLYGLLGGGVLECQEYNYFYEYSPKVITNGSQVTAIGDNKVQATIKNGTVNETTVSGEFNGCDFDKFYGLDNGLIFACATYDYTYAYRPTVQIFTIEKRQPVIQIDGKQYHGTLHKGTVYETSVSDEFEGCDLTRPTGWTTASYSDVLTTTIRTLTDLLCKYL